MSQGLVALMVLLLYGNRHWWMYSTAAGLVSHQVLKNLIIMYKFIFACVAGAVCAAEITNSLTWPVTTIGISLSQFCLQTEGEPIPYTICLTEHV